MWHLNALHSTDHMQSVPPLFCSISVTFAITVASIALLFLLPIATFSDPVISMQHANSLLPIVYNTSIDREMSDLYFDSLRLLQYP